MAKKHKKAKPDDEIEKRYVFGVKISYRALAKWAYRSRSYVEKLGSRKDFPSKREHAEGMASEIAFSVNVDDYADRLAALDDLGGECVMLALERCREHLGAGTITAANLNKVTASVKMALETGRLVTGKPTLIIGEVERQLREQNPELFENIQKEAI